MVSTRVYGEYQRDQVGWFLGLTGLQLGILAGGALPVVSAVHAGAWRWAFAGVLGWVVLLGLVVVPVQGRTASGWAVAAATSLLGRRAGWSSFRSLLSQGRTGQEVVLDLPGVMSGLRVHDLAAAGQPVALLQHLPSRVWAVTARITHPGVWWATPAERDQLGVGLSAVLDGVCRAGLAAEVQVLVRVAPDDGADRDRWLAANRSEAPPSPLARKVHDELRHHLAPAANRTETFVTVVISERRLRRAARGSSGALGGRSEVLTGVMTEVSALLTGPLGAQGVEWLTAEDLAAACRSGFQPPCAGVLHVSAKREQGRGWAWADAGVARAETQPRWYAHGGHRSVSSALLLPARGASLGSLGPVLSGGSAGEARSLLVGFPVLPPDLAERRTASREWAADLGDGLRDRARIRPRAQARANNEAARAVDAKLVRGASLCRPYAVATVTVSADRSCEDAARRLDASVRQAGFTGQRLDLAHDVGFAAGCLPLGLSLDRTGDRA